MRSNLASFALIIRGIAVAVQVGRGQEKKPTEKASATDIAMLIRQLGSSSFATRDKARQALVKIGEPALEPLRKAAADAPELEIRRRAVDIMNEIDPLGPRRTELAAAQKTLLKALEKRIEKCDTRGGVDVANWAESVGNPFSNLTTEGKARLAAQGVDVVRLQKMRARYLRGSYGGALQKEFVNTDPDTILIVGKGFCTHGGFYSVGPVLAVENAYFMARIEVANLLWFVDRAGSSNGVAAMPALAAEGAGSHALRSTPSMVVGDFGFRRPKSFLQPLVAADAKNDSPPLEALATAKKELAEKVKQARGEDVTQWATAIANPFSDLTSEGKDKLKLRGVDLARFPKLKAVHLTGSHCGANSKDFVNNDPDTVLVIGKGFVTHGQVYSLGPILAVENAHFMNNVTGADVVWFVDESFPRGRTVGAPVILAPTASHSQMHVASKLTWQGDYGWRRPGDFPAFLNKAADNPPPLVWQPLIEGKLATVSVAKTLFEQKEGKYFLAAVRVTSKSNRDVGVDLRSRQDCVRINQWSARDTPERTDIDERRQVRPDFTEKDKASLAKEFAAGKLLRLPMGKSVEYYCPFIGEERASNRAAVEKLKSKFIILSMDGELRVTNGEQSESLRCGEPGKADISIARPVPWHKILDGDRVVNDDERERKGDKSPAKSQPSGK